MKTACIVIGSYVNGYSIVQELYENGVRDIYVFDVSKDVAAFSKKTKRFYRIDHSCDNLKENLLKISRIYDKLVLYPNQDIYVGYLNVLYEDIKSFCFMAFNPGNATSFQSKLIQYDFCHKLNVPCPKTVNIESEIDLLKLSEMPLPFIIKPTKRDNLETVMFRVKEVKNAEELSLIADSLKVFINQGFSFVASEIIPGDGSQIYAYTAYRSKQGKMLGEWAGKKLSQFPNDYGVFSSASTQAPNVVKEQGRILLEGMDLWGVNEPEFKYDYRDGKYKLMEINLRPMMWHRLGALCGVPLNYIQYLEATNQNIPNYIQTNDLIHYAYFHHEWINLIRRKKYWEIFKNNLFSKNKTVLALWDIKDPMPFLFSFVSIIKRVFKVKKREK